LKVGLGANPLPPDYASATGEWSLYRGDDIEEEDVPGFDHDDSTFCIYHTTEGCFATDGMCTHEDEHLENGLVIDFVIECPLHQGRFDIRNGKALSAPVCVDLKTWPVKREGEDIYINIATD
jgi:3-phenylpropionate/trans-cinnamate dioxygenase ferredoxin subunit